MELMTLIKKLNTQHKCIKYLEQLRWGSHPTCPYCNSTSSTSVKKEKRHHCNKCNKSFSVLIGTIFQDSNLTLPKWFIAISLILNAKKGISSRQLARHIKVTKDTAWYLQKRVRKAMKEDAQLFKGIVEIDESYIGGNLKNKSKKVRKELKRAGKAATGMIHKTAVFGMLERKGKIKVEVVDLATGEILKPIIRNKVDRKSILVTDGFGAYCGLAKEYKGHEILNHEKDEFVRGKYHTNNIEGFWSLVKRGIVGQYHKITRKHLQDYLNEFSFKYNYKNTENIFELFICRALFTNNYKMSPT